MEIAWKEFQNQSEISKSPSDSKTYQTFLKSLDWVRNCFEFSFECTFELAVPMRWTLFYFTVLRELRPWNVRVNSSIYVYV